MKGHFIIGKNQENRHKKMGIDYQLVMTAKWIFIDLQ